MTIELLFAKTGQCRTFLLMSLLGAAVTLLLQLGGALRRRSRLLGAAADVLTALFFALAAAQIILRSGEGLRGYGLLGLCIGGGLYLGCGAPVVERLESLFKRPK